MTQLEIKKQLEKYPYRVEKVALVLLEHSDFNSGILDTANAVIEYDILVWTNETGLVFEKTGKTSKEKLEDTLSFYAPMDIYHHIVLDLTVIINGKRYPFLTLSDDDKVINNLRRSMEKKLPEEISRPYFLPSLKPYEEQVKSLVSEDELGNIPVEAVVKVAKDVVAAGIEAKSLYQINSDLTDEENATAAEQEEMRAIAEATSYNEKLQIEIDGIFKEFNSEGHLDIILYVMEQNMVNDLVKKNIGKILVNVDDVVNKIENLSLKVKIKNKKIDIRKKQSLGSLFTTSEESEILDYFKKDNLYVALLNLVRAYQETGLTNLSPYRYSVYESLKAATDNLIVLKGKLENMDFVPKNVEVVAKDKK